VRAPTSCRSLFAVLCVVVGLPVACAGDVPEVPVGPGGTLDAELVLGRDIYERRCANCHGADGGGGTGPKLADGRVVEQYPDPADQRALILDGRNAMPSFDGRLTSGEIDAVVRYTREVLD